jgi:hypothetical protein
MGAWGVGAFENDSAADWIADLPAALPQTLRLTLRPVIAIEPDLYLDERDSSEAIAAAEVIAAMAGRPGDAVLRNPEVAEWAQEHSEWLDPDLVRDASAAVDRVHTSSELRDLWSESADYELWLAALDDLRRRLID